ncbi:LytTR family DNA-binding domain-containing protein [Streptococcus sobrinus]|uniref:LytTR family DNA-binding domain-containing protein n=2 Tax=Streptococcus sobrinus TaxID=1310 RepID=UPI0002FDE1EF|nr:LytTR family DNA-binding domain-containing protein [Streptococcus sobrinus]OZV24314.1 LytTR family transcriptional regulator [Streptococcus sobrinus]
MQYYFEEKENLKLDEVQVLVQSQKRTKEVQEILDYLGAYDQGEVTVLPIKTSDRFEMLKVDDLIYADVEGDSLILETSKGRILTNDRLYKFSQRLNNPDFVQVSKHALLNINHLEALEASFSGNMLAILTGKRKLDVSRRYLVNLEKRLGL